MNGARGAAVVGPVIWGFFGYEFEAGPMVVGLLACLIVRLYIGFKNHTSSAIVIDVIVTMLTLLFSGVLIMTRRPDPFIALIMGTATGAMGAQIIVFAMRKLKSFGFVIPEDAPPAGPVRMLEIKSDDEAAIFEAIERAKKLD